MPVLLSPGYTIELCYWIQAARRQAGRWQAGWWQAGRWQAGRRQAGSWQAGRWQAARRQAGRWQAARLWTGDPAAYMPARAMLALPTGESSEGMSLEA